MRNTLKTIFAASGLVLLAACQDVTTGTYFDPLNLQVEMAPRDDNRVQVTPSESSFAMYFRDGTADLSDAEKRAVVRFLRQRSFDGAEEVFLDVASTTIDPKLIRSRHQVVSEILQSAEIDPTTVRVRTDSKTIERNQLNLTVRRYLVTLPGCPDFTSRAGRTFDNRPHSNWGCATASNFGLMVAEPRDVLIGRGGTPGDGEALTLSMQRYRAGETKALQLDGTSTAESYGTQGESGTGGTQ